MTNRTDVSEVGARAPASDISASAGSAAESAVNGEPPYAVRTRGLRKSFGRTLAVDGVDLEVPVGSVLGMLGPNGSGKTTTIRLLLGLSRPDAGEVELLGAAMPDRGDEVLAHVGALVEGPGFHPFLSGRENLRRVAAAEPLLRTADIPSTVDEVLRRVGLAAAAGRRYKGYSLGMKQRLGLAGALLVPRRLVVLDEPTNGLDPAGTREIRALIADLHRAGTTVIVSSHLLSEIEATCTHVAVLSKGVVVAQGPLAELLEADAPTLRVRTTDPEAAVEALRAARIPARAEGDLVRVELADAAAPAVIETLVHAGVPVHEARRDRTGLEDLFAALTDEDGGSA